MILQRVPAHHPGVVAGSGGFGAGDALPLARLSGASKQALLSSTSPAGHQQAVRVAIQHRRRMCREAMALLVRERHHQELVGTAATADDLVSLCERDQVDVVLVELDATDWDPCRLAAALSRRHPSLRFVGIHGPRSGRQAQRGRRAGMTMVLCATGGVTPIIEALGEVCRQRPQAIIVPAGPTSPLSAREVQVLAHVALGLTSWEVAERLAIRTKTVENHKQRLFAKLGVQNQAHAVAVAIRDGLLPGTEATPTTTPVGW